jgi:DNA polymerase-4
VTAPAGTVKAYPILCRGCGTAGHVGGAAPPAECPACGAANIRVHDDLFALTIAHIDCDAFYASIEKRDDPTLVDKPVIVGGGPRGVVAAACYVARRYGVRSAMPTGLALRKCPDAVVIRPRMAHYAAIGKAIREKMLALTPLVQPLSIDEAFLDLAGTQRLHRASPAEMLHRLQHDIKTDLGITVSVGLAANKSLAKLASDADKPDGFFVIGASEAAGWLAPQPVSVLFGLGRAAVARLNAIGVKTCADLVQGNDAAIEKVLGGQTQRIVALARGVDPRPVTVERAPRSLSSETTFATDMSSFAALEAVLEDLCREVSTRLKEKGVSGKTVTLKLKSSTHRIITRSRTVSNPLDKAYSLFDVGRDLLRPETEKGIKYRLLGIGVGNFSAADAMPGLALEDSVRDRRDRLEAVFDKLHRKLGSDSLQTGRQFSRHRSRGRGDA